MVTYRYLDMEVGFRRGGDREIQQARVKRRIFYQYGTPIFRQNNNSLLDTYLYEVEYLDGGKEVLADNILAENILEQVGEEGY